MRRDRRRARPATRPARHHHACKCSFSSLPRLRLCARAQSGSRQKNSTLEALVRLRAASSAHPNANVNVDARNVKLFAWCSRVPATLFFFHSPAERGGIGDIRKRVKEEAARRRAPEEEVCEEVSMRARVRVFSFGSLWTRG